jgi:hypothetical protein
VDSRRCRSLSTVVCGKFSLTGEDSDFSAEAHGGPCAAPLTEKTLFVIKNKPDQGGGSLRVRCDQCGGPGGVVLVSCSTAEVILHREVGEPIRLATIERVLEVADVRHATVIGHGDLAVEHDFSPAGQQVAERRSE